MSVLAGSLEIEILANIARLQKDMGDAKNIIGNTMSSVERAAGTAAKALGALGVGLSAAAFGSMIKGAIDAADAINKLTQRTGFAAESLSQWQYAAKLADVSNDTLTTGIKKLNVSVAQGLAGDREKIALFKSLGITTADLGKGTESVMMKMADSFAASRDGAGKAAVSIGLLGKAGDEMIPLLNGGSGAIRGLMEEADRLGLTITSDFAKKAEEFNDNLTRLKTGSQNLAIALGTDVVDALGNVAQAMTDAKLAGAGGENSFASVLGKGIRVVIETVAVLGANLIYIFDRARAELGSWMAQVAAFARGDFTAFSAISAAVTADGIKARAELDKLEQRLMGVKDKFDDPRILGRVGSIAEQTAGWRPDIKAPSTTTAATVSEYDALIKKIKERITLSVEEVAAGRELTEEEKFAVRVNQDLVAAKKALTPEQKIIVADLLAESARLFDANAQRAKRLKMMQAEAEFIMENEAEIAAASTADSKAREQVAVSITNQYAALADANEMLAAEAKLMGASDKERQIAIEHLKIEQKLRADIWELDHNTAFNESQRATERARLVELATLGKAMVTQRAGMEEHLRIWASVDQTAHDVFVNIFEGGSNVFKKLTQVLKSTLLELLYQMTVKKWILQFAASGTGQSISGVASDGIGNSLVSSGLNAGASYLFGGAGAALSAGYAGATAAMAGGATFGTTGAIGGYAAAMGTGATGAAGVGGSLMAGGSAALAAIPVAGWIALAGLAIAAIAGGGGETRSGGTYDGTKFVEGPSGGEIGGEAVRSAVTATMGMINSTLTALGSSATLKGFLSGLESSEKGRGFAFAGGSLSTGENFGAYNRTLGIQVNRGSMTQEQANAAYALELKRAAAGAIAASDAVGPLADAVRALGDISQATGEAIDTVLNRISKALTEKATLEQRLFELTATDLEKLTKTRNDERAAIDPTNLALLEQVYVQEDLKTAAQEAQSALEAVSTSIKIHSQTALDEVNRTQAALLDGYNREATEKRALIDRSREYARTLRAERDAMLLGDSSPLNAMAQASVARAQYDATLTKALAGDADAQAAYLGNAKQLLATQQATSSTSAQLTTIFIKVREDMRLLADTSDATADVQLLQLNAMTGILQGLGLLQTTQQAGFAALVSAYQGAKAAYVATDPGANSINALYQSVLGRQGDMGGIAFYQGWLDRGLSLADVAAAMNNSPEKLGIPQMATGTNWLPQDMLVYAHQGEAIVPAQYNPAAGGFTELADAINSLGSRLEKIESNTGDTKKATEASTTMLRMVTRDGQSIVVTQD